MKKILTFFLLFDFTSVKNKKIGVSTPQNTIIFNNRYAKSKAGRN